MAKISAERVYLTTNDGRSLDFKRELHVDKVRRKCEKEELKYEENSSGDNSR